MANDADSDDEIAAGGDIDSLSVTLSVSADDLEPDAVTALLGISPTFAAAKGQRRQSGRATVVQRTGVWLLRLPTSSEWELSDAIKTLLSRLPDDLAIWERLRSRYALALCVGIFLQEWNRGGAISSEMIQQLAARGLSLDLDIYAHGPEDV